MYGKLGFTSRSNYEHCVLVNVSENNLRGKANKIAWEKQKKIEELTTRLRALQIATGQH